jgi:hypothetical protein
MGADDRQDVYATSDGWLRALGEGSMAALVLDSKLKTLPGVVSSSVAKASRPA